MQPGIVFDGVWKKFRRGEHHDSLRDLLPAMAARAVRRRDPADLAEREFWAVKDVSFEVQPGQALGIIGPNGAGKSTILKLLTRILRPTRGACEVRGRVGALIEVAAGFHPDLTGRENVYLQGAIVGMKRTEIDRTFDQIVEFAGVGAFIDTPVKRFSSGMNARLGFAIAAHLDPDVLIIDEVLSVGDASFQAQCLQRMRDLVARGVPLVSVSHNLPSILALCSHALLLDHGEVRYIGDATETLREYRRSGIMFQRAAGAPAHGIRLTQVRLLDEAGVGPDAFASGRPLVVRIGYEAGRPIAHPEFAADIHTADGRYCCGVSTRLDGHDFGVVSGAGHVDLQLRALNLAAGQYSVSVGIHLPGIGLCDLHEFAYPLSITSTRHELGPFVLDHTWRHQAHDAQEVLAS